MFHRYTVTEDRIEGPVFRAGIRWPRALLYELCAVILDYILIRSWKDWGDSSEAGKYLVGAFLLILCLFCHLYPLLDRKWFVMDEKALPIIPFAGPGSCPGDRCAMWIFVFPGAPTGAAGTA